MHHPLLPYLTIHLLILSTPPLQFPAKLFSFFLHKFLVTSKYLSPVHHSSASMAHKQDHGTSCCCCLFGILWKILVALIVPVGLAILIFWLVVQPRSFKFHVTEADLTQFDFYTNNNTLHYNMVLNFTARTQPKQKTQHILRQSRGISILRGCQVRQLQCDNAHELLPPVQEDHQPHERRFLGAASVAARQRPSLRVEPRQEWWGVRDRCEALLQD